MKLLIGALVAVGRFAGWLGLFGFFVAMGALLGGTGTLIVAGCLIALVTWALLGRSKRRSILDGFDDGGGEPV